MISYILTFIAGYLIGIITMCIFIGGNNRNR